jgi:hypothetical protein
MGKAAIGHEANETSDVDTFKRKVSKGTVLQALVNLAAYSAATNFLPASDAEHHDQAQAQGE